MNQQPIKTLLIVLTAMLFIAGCKQTNLLTIVLREYKHESMRSIEDKDDSRFYTYYDGKYLGVMTSDTVRSKRVIFGRLLGNVYGHRFEFDKQNVLSRYIFDVDGGAHYSYGVELSKNNQYSETGDPYVDRWRDASYPSKDSTRYIFFFSKFPRKKVQAFYSFDSTTYKNLKLENSKVMPYLTEGKITVPNALKTIYLKIEAESLLYPLKGLQERRVFLESESL